MDDEMHERNLPECLAHGIEAINAFIDDTPPLTALQRQFCKTYLAARHEAEFK